MNTIRRLIVISIFIFSTQAVAEMTPGLVEKTRVRAHTIWRDATANSNHFRQLSTDNYLDEEMALMDLFELKLKARRLKALYIKRRNLGSDTLAAALEDVAASLENVRNSFDYLRVGQGMRNRLALLEIDIAKMIYGSGGGGGGIDGGRDWM